MALLETNSKQDKRVFFLFLRMRIWQGTNVPVRRDLAARFWSEKLQSSGRALLRVTVLLEFNTHKSQGWELRWPFRPLSCENWKKKNPSFEPPKPPFPAGFLSKREKRQEREPTTEHFWFRRDNERRWRQREEGSSSGRSNQVRWSSSR